MSATPQPSWEDDDPYSDHAGYPEDDCDHEDYEADILDGTAKCWRCGYRWTQTASEIEREIEAQRAWDEQCEAWEHERRSPLNRMRNLVMRVRVWWQRPRPRETDDEIPF